MTEVHVVPKDMKASIDVATDAESAVRKADSAGHLTKAGAAVPGAESVTYMSDLGTRWTDETKTAADSSQKLAAETQKALDEFEAADHAAGEKGGKVMGPN